MTKIICDKCHTEIDKHAAKGWHLMSTGEYGIVFVSGNECNLDLCPTCYEEYQAIIQLVEGFKKDRIAEWRTTLRI